MVKSFIQYLLEANSAGSKFEQQVADAVVKYIHDNSLDAKFGASRYQSITEIELNEERDEDYSDIEVVDKVNDETFFIECKKEPGNVFTQFFDFNDGVIVPVAGKSRTPIEFDTASPLGRLVADIQNSIDFKNFEAFLNNPCELLDNNTPASVWDANATQLDKSVIVKLVDTYNKSLTSKESAKLSATNINKSCVGMMAIGIAWKLISKKHIWDIVHVDVPYFGELVKWHYLTQKAVPAKYIQIANNTFALDNDDPLETGCAKFPDELNGRFTLKFTPRISTGKMYITSRSKILDKLQSNFSFI